jgi:O-antigen ligase
MSRLDFSPVYAQYGLDRIWGLTPQYPAYVTDTFWPHVLGEIGVLGVVAYVAFLFALGVELWRATRAMTNPVMRAFCLGAFMVFLHSLVESLASSMYESPPRIYLAFGAMGIALALSRLPEKADRPLEPKIAPTS